MEWNVMRLFFIVWIDLKPMESNSIEWNAFNYLPSFFVPLIWTKWKNDCISSWSTQTMKWHIYSILLCPTSFYSALFHSAPFFLLYLNIIIVTCRINFSFFYTFSLLFLILFSSNFLLCNSIFLIFLIVKLWTKYVEIF